MNSAKLLVRAMILVIVGSMILAGCAAGNNVQVIKIGHANFDYESLPLEVVKQIAEDKGYEVEIVEGDVGFMFLSLQQGDTDIWPGIWLPNLHASYEERFGDDYELGGMIFNDAPIGWAVPSYVDAHSIEDLVGNEGIVNHKLIGVEPGNGMMIVSEETIEAYDLDLELVSGSTPGMFAEVDYLISQEEPVLFLGWRPHPFNQKHDIRYLEDSKGFWSPDNFYWGIGLEFKEKAPDIYNLVKNFEMDIETIEWSKVNIHDGVDASELAEEWLSENRSKVDQWMEN